MKKLSLKYIMLVLPITMACICFFANACIVSGASALPDYYMDFTAKSALGDLKRLQGLEAEYMNGELQLSADGTDAFPTAVIYLPDPAINAEVYKYVAIRLKASEVPAKGKFQFYLSSSRSTLMTAEWAYAQTADWQTVVVDITEAGSISGNYSKGITLELSDSPVRGDRCFSLNSVAFFSSAEAAAKFTGFENNDALLQAQAGKWRVESFVFPDAAYTMTKLLYEFAGNYEAQVDSLHNSFGYGGVVTNVAFNNNYLKDKRQFSLVKNGFSYALRSGMKQLWIYDEYQWPSGSAFGQTAEGHPEFESIAMAQFTSNGTGGIQFELPKEYDRIVYAFAESAGGERSAVRFSETKVEDEAPYARWKLYVYAVKRTFEDPGPSAHDFERKPYINIMSEGAVSRFISLTHEKYKQFLGDTFSAVEAFFTDEPSLRSATFQAAEATYLMPWEDSLPDVFTKMHGYSILNCLDSVFEGDSEQDKAVRVNFYQTVGAMIAENYFGQIERWCAENHVKSSGHLLLEERLSMHVGYYGDAMACLKKMGIPGCDILHVTPSALLSSTTYVGNYLGCKFASSASRNTGKYDTFMEFNPSNPEDPTFLSGKLHQSLGGVTLCAFFGINRFNMLNPFESYTDKEATLLNEYTGRINTILDNAEMVSGIGVFYPIATMQGLFTADNTHLLKTEQAVSDLDAYYSGLCLALLKAQLDYNILDEESILSGTIQDGCITIGNSTYRVIVMPCVEILSLDTMEKLADFTASGGKVIWVGRVPTIASRYGETEALRAISNRYAGEVLAADGESFANVTEAVKAVADYGYTFISSPDTGLFISPYKAEGKQILFIANSNDRDETFTFSLGEDASYSVYDPQSGVITDYKGQADITCGGYRGLLIVADEACAVLQTKDTAGSNLHWILIGGAAAAVCGAGAVIVLKKKKARVE